MASILNTVIYLIPRLNLLFSQIIYISSYLKNKLAALEALINTNIASKASRKINIVLNLYLPQLILLLIQPNVQLNLIFPD